MKNFIFLSIGLRCGLIPGNIIGFLAACDIKSVASFLLSLLAAILFACGILFIGSLISIINKMLVIGSAIALLGGMTIGILSGLIADRSMAAGLLA